MLRIISVIFALIFAISAQPVFAADIDCSAQCAAVIDAVSQEVIYAKNENEERSIASTTKIMSALIACESGKINDVVEITFDMVNTHGTLLGLREGDKITLYDLVAGMLLPSGNDAANAVALYLGGSFEGFSAMMNKKAAELGMYNSYFVTPSGLDEGNHHSTAYDMAILTARAIQNEYFSQLCCLKSYDVTINGEKMTIYNHNKLLSSMDSCIGVKTGYTDKAGRCLVSAFSEDGHTFVCVTLNAPDDWNDHKKLYEYANAQYKSKDVSDSFFILTVGGEKNSVRGDYSANVSVLNPNEVTVELYAFPFIYAPVKKGEQIGKAVIKYKEKELLTVPVTAGENVNYYARQE